MVEDGVVLGVVLGWRLLQKGCLVWFSCGLVGFLICFNERVFYVALLLAGN
tara:strand:- start:169 stop:321 length:153 start_codon:yes stop_codon:yes gene_type:complete